MYFWNVFGALKVKNLPERLFPNFYSGRKNYFLFAENTSNHNSAERWK